MSPAASCAGSAMSEPTRVRLILEAQALARERFAGRTTLFLAEVQEDPARGFWRLVDAPPESGVILKINTKGRPSVVILPREAARLYDEN